MSGKRILFYVPYLGNGGVTIALRSVILILENAGFHCGIILPEKRFLRNKDLFDVIPQKYVEAYAWNAIKHRKGIGATLIKLFNIVTRWCFYFHDTPQVPHDVFVVYHVLGSEQWVNYSSRPTIGWLHGAIWPRKGLGATMSRWMHSFTLNRFNKLIAVSNNVSAMWNGAYRLRTAPEVLLNVIDIDDILNRGNEEQSEIRSNVNINLLFVGRMAHEKGLLRLLKCLTNLHRTSGVCFDLWVIGIGGWYTEEIDINRYLERNHDIKKHIHFLGYRSNPYPYMKAADLLVVPSYEEGFGLVIWESLLMHCPVLATDAGGCGEALRHGTWGALVENTDESLYEGLRRYFQDSAIASPKCDFATIESEIRKINNKGRERLVDLFNKLAFDC